jgi:hypothetical protein
MTENRLTPEELEEQRTARLYFNHRTPQNLHRHMQAVGARLRAQNEPHRLEDRPSLRRAEG